MRSLSPAATGARIVESDDGVVEHAFDCPYCWESITVLVDTSVPEQEYVEDCEVCCNPWRVRVYRSDGKRYVDLKRADGSE